MNSANRFGMVQGRLTQSPPGCLQWFPQEDWRHEFSVAADIGINFIELIAEVQYNPENPIWTDDGIENIKQLVKDKERPNMLLPNKSYSRVTISLMA